MKNHITIVGNVVAAPQRRSTGAGEAVANFRVACNESYLKDGTWHDGGTSFYAVSAFRKLAENVLASLSQGQRVIVSGTVRIREWENGDKHGSSADIDAEAVGPDLLFGITAFQRTAGSAPARQETPGTATDADGWAAPGVDASEADASEADASEVAAPGPADGDRETRPAPEREMELVGAGFDTGDPTPF